ncbi:hypothetical protein QR680_015463 [Steinernema hermaphroditum]|uniref:Uncharacterized protein n=1 Tax=Steinernema hermaphroditum TaxID=289476 RepID=A0AA39H9Y9_9BILA|nr:hypothetical protein QR680_015463 [Steinernema hermaphroditum]
MVHLYNEQTLKMHKKFLRYLIVITAVPVACGLLPIAISALNDVFLPPYALQIVMGTYIMIYIDSTLFFAVCIFAFAPYRQAPAPVVVIDSFRLKLNVLPFENPILVVAEGVSSTRPGRLPQITMIRSPRIHMIR